MLRDPYGQLLQRVLLPGYESVIRGRPTHARRALLEETQWRPLDELEALQQGALRRLVQHAYTHVPFYRDRFERARVSPDEIRGVSDLPRLPRLTRGEVRDSAGARGSTAPPLAVVRKATGGTTGQPLAFGYDLESEYWRQAVKLRGYGWAGYEVGDPSLHYWGAPPPRPRPPRLRAKTLVDRALKRERYFDCTVRSDDELLRVARYLGRVRPRVLVCYTQAGADLARFVLDRGLRDWGDLTVLCCAERLFPADRAALKAAFGPAVYETYGCREVMLIGSECEAHDGLHLSYENLIIELVVTEGGAERPARAGETGEVVITDLHNLGMPFIRYESGDVAVQGSTEPCACGRTLPRISRVEGRVADTLRDGRGNRVAGLVFNVMFTALAQAVRQFQAVQHPDGSVTLKVIPGSGFDENARVEVRRHLQQVLPGVEVRIETVGEIPASASGKRQVVVVER
jgi:phenylacetate-CoA ligase